MIAITITLGKEVVITIAIMITQEILNDYYYGYEHVNNRINNTHFFINDLLGQRIPITEQQYRDKNITTPNNLSQ